MTDYRHWKRELRADGVLHVQIDVAESSVNVLSQAVLDELQLLIQEIEQAPATAVILSSAKTAGFLAGADINEFLELKSREAVVAKLRPVDDLFLRIERLPCPTVALIHGHCLGGGLELALACSYRVADQSAESKIGLPEVKLGIHPGYGGAVRLSRLINPLSALNLMLAGRLLDGRQAAKMGVVDVATQQRHLMTAALQLALRGRKPKRKRSFSANLLSIGPARQIASQLAHRQLKKRVREEHYPAPFRLLDFWTDLPAGDEPAYQAEAESVASLFDHPNGARAAHNLVQLFLRDREIKGRAKAVEFAGRHVHVVGAGVMGGDIAAWCALRGFTVTLQDAKAEWIGPAIGRAHKLFERKEREAWRVNRCMDRLIPDALGDGVAHADLVIEAITENLQAKTQLYAKLEPRMKAGAILASNTSSIPLEELAAGLNQPQRLVGIHFFNPVAQMQLVEIVAGQHSGAEQLALARAFVNRLGKLPIDVKSSPGFLVNRVLMAYLAESLRLLEEGYDPRFIDQVAEKLGFPMGPIELSDTVGLDICQAVARELIPILGGEESALLNARVEKKELGKKTGQGFYTWTKGKADKSRVRGKTSGRELVRDRLLYALLNEAVQCLAEGIVSDADALDLAMVFGTGFPPFHGGPMSHIRELGQEHCVARLQELAEQVDPRFAPNSGWAAVRL